MKYYKKTRKYHLREIFEENELQAITYHKQKSAC